ncbi:MAG: sugar-binding transcriptional regulator [Ancrocorticia sp.]|uniref:sugar-binding transcriptional regulator n=1 Tax=Ancrocorticia sp. TaxID=2593684 RepID=UPI003F8FB920
MDQQGVSPIDNGKLRDDLLIVEVATRFYLHDESKVAIAEALHISRFKVARLLEEARARGIVEIAIHDPTHETSRLAFQLKEHLHLDEVYVVSSMSDISAERDAMGQMGAHVLENRLVEGNRVGLGWGRSLTAVAEHLGTLPPSEFVQMMGVIGNDASRSPVVVLEHIARKSGGVAAKALVTPLFCTTPAVAASQRAEPSIAEVLRLYEGIDIAFFSIGSWENHVTQLEDIMPAADKASLDEANIIADVGGIFIDSSGRYVDVPLNERRVSISVEQIAKIPFVTAVAGGLNKVSAIRAVCCSGLATCLITTSDVAQELLTLPDIKETVFRG